jgi:hypothetical protein
MTKTSCPPLELAVLDELEAALNVLTRQFASVQGTPSLIKLGVGVAERRAGIGSHG